MSRYKKQDWAELLIVLFLLVAAVIVLGFTGALVGELIIRLLG